MILPEITCPECGLPDQVEKVSTLYLVGTELKRNPRREKFDSTDAPSPTMHAVNILRDRQRTQPGVEPLERKLKPPSSGKTSTTRPIHPDLAVLAFSLIVPVFVYGVVTSQPGTIPAVIALLTLFYSLYFWGRRWLVNRFNMEQIRRKGVEQRTARAVKRWMQLYYCGNEELVFDPATGESVPVDQMMGLIWPAEQE